MKTIRMLAAALTLCCVLSACGGSGAEPVKDVDLTAFYDALAEEYDWTEDSMMRLDDEMLELYYPGLGDLSAKQRLAISPVMSYAVNEYVFMQCESEKAAAEAADILQSRVDSQAGGDAWYPETVEQWKCAKVITTGGYVAMIASGEHQADIEAAWNALLAE